MGATSEVKKGGSFVQDETCGGGLTDEASAGSSSSTAEPVPFPSSRGSRPALSPRTSSLLVSSSSPPDHRHSTLAIQRPLSPTFDPFYPASLEPSPTPKRRLTRSHPASPTLAATSTFPTSKTFPSFSLDPHGPLSPLEAGWLPLPPIDDLSPTTTTTGSSTITITRRSTDSPASSSSTTFIHSSAASSVSSASSTSSRARSKLHFPTHSPASTPMPTPTTPTASTTTGGHRDRERRGSHASVSFGTTSTRVFQKDEKTSSVAGTPSTSSPSSSPSFSSSVPLHPHPSVRAGGGGGRGGVTSTSEEGGEESSSLSEGERLRSWRWRHSHRGASPTFASSPFSSRVAPSFTPNPQPPSSTSRRSVRLGQDHPRVKGPRRSFDAASWSPSSRGEPMLEKRGYRSSFSGLSSLFTPAHVASIDDLDLDDPLPSPSSSSSRSRHDVPGARKGGTRSAPGSRNVSRVGSMVDLFTTASTSETSPSRHPSTEKRARRRASPHLAPTTSSSPLANQLHFPLPHLPSSTPSTSTLLSLTKPLTPLISVAIYTFITSVAALALAGVMMVGFGLTAFDDVRKRVREAGRVRKGLVEGARGVVEGVVQVTTQPRFRSRSGRSTPTTPSSASTPPSSSSSPTASTSSSTSTSATSTASWTKKASRVLPAALIDALMSAAVVGHDGEAGPEDGSTVGAGIGEERRWTRGTSRHQHSHSQSQTQHPQQAPANEEAPEAEVGEEEEEAGEGQAPMPRPPWSVLFGSLVLTACIFVGRGALMWWLEKRREESAAAAAAAQSAERGYRARAGSYGGEGEGKEWVGMEGAKGTGGGEGRWAGGMESGRFEEEEEEEVDDEEAVADA